MNIIITNMGITHKVLHITGDYFSFNIALTIDELKELSKKLKENGF